MIAWIISQKIREEKACYYIAKNKGKCWAKFLSKNLKKSMLKNKIGYS